MGIIGPIKSRIRRRPVAREARGVKIAKDAVDAGAFVGDNDDDKRGREDPNDGPVDGARDRYGSQGDAV